MTSKDNGGPAFPSHGSMGEVVCDGMTLRDYFAAKAMQGMLAYPGCDSRGSHHNNNTPQGVAIMAYAYADAMIAERDK